jgi:hypothetical protein
MVEAARDAWPLGTRNERQPLEPGKRGLWEPKGNPAEDEEEKKETQDHFTEKTTYRRAWGHSRELINPPAKESRPVKTRAWLSGFSASHISSPLPPERRMRHGPTPSGMVRLRSPCCYSGALARTLGQPEHAANTACGPDRKTST